MKKRIASLLLAMVMLLSLCTQVLADEEQPLIEGSGGVAESSFTDVPRDYIFYDDIDTVVAAGLFKGTTPTTFSPYGSMLRGQFVMVLARLDEDSNVVEGEPTQTVFSDVDPGYRFSGAIKWATDAGIVEGYSDGTFRPRQAITRAQIAALVYRYIMYKGYELKDFTDDPDEPASPQFTDYEQASAVFRGSLDYCRAHGLIRGFSDGSYRPNIAVTRAQMAAILHRIIIIINGLHVYVLPLAATSANHGAVPTYTITRRVTVDGEAQTQTIAPSNLKQGDTVTVSHAPNNGYYASITLYRDAEKRSRINSSSVRITRSNDGKSSTFIMPGYDVWVEIVYTRQSSGGGGGGVYRPPTADVYPNMAAGTSLLVNGAAVSGSMTVNPGDTVTINHPQQEGKHVEITIRHRPYGSSAPEDWATYTLTRLPTGEIQLSDASGAAIAVYPADGSPDSSWFTVPGRSTDDGTWVDLEVTVRYVDDPAPTLYTVTLASIAEGGSATVASGTEVTLTTPGTSERVLAEGDEVSINAAPADGYRLASITIDPTVTLSPAFDQSVTAYTFTMPAADVTVTVTFETIPVEPAETYYALYASLTGTEKSGEEQQLVGVVGEESTAASATHLRGDASFFEALKALDGNPAEEQAVLVDGRDYGNKANQDNKFQFFKDKLWTRFDSNPPTKSIVLDGEMLAGPADAQNNTLLDTLISRSRSQILSALNTTLRSDTTAAAVRERVRAAVESESRARGIGSAVTITGTPVITIPGITNGRSFDVDSANYAALRDGIAGLLRNNTVKAYGKAVLDPAGKDEFLSADVIKVAVNEIVVNGTVSGAATFQNLEVSVAGLTANFEGGGSVSVEDGYYNATTQTLTVSPTVSVNVENYTVNDVSPSLTGFYLSESSYGGMLTNYFEKMQTYLDFLGSILQTNPVASTSTPTGDKNAYDKFLAFYNYTNPSDPNSAIRIVRTNGNITEIWANETQIAKIDDDTVSISLLGNADTYHELYDWAIDQINDIRKTIVADAGSEALAENTFATLIGMARVRNAANPLMNQERILTFLDTYHAGLAKVLAREDPTVEYVFETMGAFEFDFTKTFSGSAANAFDRVGLQPKINVYASFKSVDVTG